MYEVYKIESFKMLHWLEFYRKNTKFLIIKASKTSEIQNLQKFNLI